MKRCPRCTQIKRREDFARNRSNSDGLVVYCRPCWSAYHTARRKLESPERAARRRQVDRLSKLKTKYGVAPERYEQILAEQGGLCAVCREASDVNLAVDHDHACCPGRTSCGACVRGLLCQACNGAAGLLKDSLENTLALANYLSRAALKAAA